MKTTTRIKSLFMLAAIAVSMLTLASCSKNDPASTDEIPMKEFLVGSWKQVKVERYKDGAYQEQTPNRWIITYTADGEFMEYIDGNPGNSRTYTLEGDELTLNYEKGFTLIFTLTFPDKDTLVMVMKSDKNRFTYRRIETPVSSIAVIDGVQKPVLSAEINAGELEENSYEIYLHLSADDKEYIRIQASKEQHDGKDIDLTVKKELHEGGYWSIAYSNSGNVFSTYGVLTWKEPVFLKGKLYIKRIDDIDGQPAFEIRIDDGEVKAEAPYGDGERHTVSLNFRGKTERI